MSTRTRVVTTLRLSENLRKWLMVKAAEDDRSFNSTVTRILNKEKEAERDSKNFAS